MRAFLNDVADELERAQNQSTAMEARARAAVARLQEMSEGQPTEAPAAPTAVDPEPVTVSADQSDTISRTLVLAQRTADSLIAEAKAESARLVATANNEAATTRDSTREMASTMLDEAREEARRVGEAERLAVASEVDSLKARRDFLESDVDHLEQFLVAQRSRIRDAAAELIDVTDRVPAGLGDARRPLLSASDDDPADHDDPSLDDADDRAATTDAGVPMESVEIIGLIDTSGDDGGDVFEGDPTQAIDLLVVTEIDAVTGGDDDPLFSLDDERGDSDPTPVGGSGFSGVDPTTADDGDDEGFRFSFDDTDNPDRPRG